MPALQTESYFAGPWAAAMKGGIRGLRLLPRLSRLFLFGIRGHVCISFWPLCPCRCWPVCHQLSPLWGRLISPSLVALRTRVAVGHMGSSHLLGRDLWYSCQPRAASKRLLMHHVSCSSWTWPVSPLSHPVLLLGYLPWHPPDPAGRGPAPVSLGFLTHTCKRCILVHRFKCFCPKCNDKNLINFKGS